MIARCRSIRRYTEIGKIMKRTATGNLEDNRKTKQTKLFEKEKKIFNLSWKHHGEAEKGIKPLMYLTGPCLSGSTKIASFDMDGCLITPKSGKRFPTGPSDWKFLSAKIQTKLKSLHEDGFKIVVFTNQAGIEKKKIKESEIESKMKDIMSSLGFPFQAFVSTGENIFRKPFTGAWDFFVKHCNEDAEVDMNSSFFVGDAAGRPKDWAPGKKKDHSCSDRKFAMNVGLKFYTPEEYFDGGKPFSRFEWGSVNPKSLLTAAGAESAKQNFDDVVSKDIEMVLLVGYPASGKSSFCKRHLQPKGYTIVNRDTLKTKEKCEKTALETLKAKKSVVVDNTNPSPDVRKIYIDIAKKAGVKVRCFHFDISKEVAQHLNYFRQAQTLGKIRRIPDVGYNMFKSKFKPPDKSEGFSEIKKIPFLPTFESETEKKLFLKWT